MLGLFKRYIEDGLEDETIELKSSYHPGEATREIVAMANSGRRGYILFGVAEAKLRKSDTPFIQSQHEHFSNTDDAERRLRQFVADKVKPVPPFRVHAFKWTNGETIGVVAVMRSSLLHEFVRDVQDRYNKVIGRPGTFIIRDGVEIRTMSSEEVARRFAEAAAAAQAPTPQTTVDVINFGHALTDEQIKELEALGYRIGIPNLGASFHLDDHAPFGPQVERILDSFGYSKAEWERVSNTTLFVLPTHAEIAGIFLAQLHGRMGHFPRIIRRTRGTDGGFHVVEVVDLQQLRNEQRARSI